MQERDLHHNLQDSMVSTNSLEAPAVKGFDEISDERLESLCIPDNLRLAAPGDLRVIYFIRDTDSLTFLTVRRHDEPQVDIGILRQYQIWKKSHPEQEDPSEFNELPGFYRKNLRVISLQENDGKPLTVYDEVLIGGYMTKHGEVLDVGDYQDKKEYRGKRVAPNFYTQLSQLAKEMGIRYIVGTNERERDRIDGIDTGREPNIDFFLKKLGRSRLTDLKEEYWEKLTSGDPDNEDYLPHYAASFTVQFLYEEDKEKMLR